MHGNQTKHVTLPRSTWQPPSIAKFSQALRAPMPWLLAALLCSTLIAPVDALDDDANALASVSVHHGGNSRAPIGPFLQLCFLIGGLAVTFTSNMLGPLMGISSVLWLMMRNDPAIDPRLSWM